MLPERTSGRYLSIEFCCARGRSQFEPLVDLKDVHRASGPWGPWNGIMPDGAPIWCEIPVPRKFMHLMSSGRSSDCVQHSRVPLRAWLLISRRSHKPAPFVRRGWGLDAIDVSTARAFTPTMSQNPTVPVQ